ncbi:hypothetical protein U9M48_030429 [Paspalum notatum var. saurae]|uniref:Disease resistance N-terminal domain-containing protein n=1 Tax=Paspalum notatum var. saurae TaxID=547442 RepID=A0AAQ3X234_PASNO
MAAQTQGAVDAMLGLLATGVKDEARLVGGVPGAMQFIKDEMDSMNGFLKHLTKIEGVQHDDQVCAWMKQVREIAYMSEDCVECYVEEILPHYGWVPVHPRHLPLPPAPREEEKKEDFRVAVEQALKDQDVVVGWYSSLKGAIEEKLPPQSLLKSKAGTVLDILNKCRPAAAEEEFRCCTRMFLCAIFLYPYPTNLEDVGARAADTRHTLGRSHTRRIHAHTHPKPPGRDTRARTHGSGS